MAGFSKDPAALSPAPSSPPPPPWSPQESPPDSPPPTYEPWQSSGSGGPAMLYPQSVWQTRDPRTSSSQSLVPSFQDEDERRILLIVYIHGFMGDNTSFRSFPAHVHNYLKEALEASHVIHSKIYPRYKTYKAIEVARDNFSQWLEPHESERTDVVLVGHSMGGLLAADVALMPSPNPVYGGPLKHRILGTISLDAPLLGLHPGIIKSGLASLFRKAPDPPGKNQEPTDGLVSPSASSSLTLDATPSFSSDGVLSSGITSPPSLSATSSHTSGSSQWPDPNFNPAFFNDVQFINRGWWRNVAHFAKKHYSEGILSSAYQHLLSHLEFGGCLADYAALNNRYNKLRRLEDVDVLNGGGAQGEVRVRFVNYYTVSTGIPKAPPLPKRADTHLRPEPLVSPQSPTRNSQPSTPRISVQDYSDNEREHSLELLDPVPEPDSDPEEVVLPQPSEGESSKARTTGPTSGDKVTSVDGLGEQDKDAEENSASISASHLHADGGDQTDPYNDLPAIPPLPEPPQPPELERYTDKDARKQAEKEYKRLQKAYDQSVKNRNKAVKERLKLIEKRQKKAQKDAEKQHKEEEKRIAKGKQQQKTKKVAPPPEEEETDEATASSSPQRQVVTPAQAQALERQLAELAFYESSSVSPGPTTGGDGCNNREEEVPVDGKKKLRKFCMLPPKVNGERDSAWVKVYMEGVDEVGAHCGLFFAGPHYEKLVGDMGSMVVGWVHEDMSSQAILALD